MGRRRGGLGELRARLGLRQGGRWVSLRAPGRCELGIASDVVPVVAEVRVAGENAGKLGGDHDKSHGVIGRETGSAIGEDCEEVGSTLGLFGPVAMGSAAGCEEISGGDGGLDFGFHLGNVFFRGHSGLRGKMGGTEAPPGS